MEARGYKRILWDKIESFRVYQAEQLNSFDVTGEFTIMFREYDRLVGEEVIC